MLSQHQRQLLIQALTPKWSRFIPITPTPTQQAFLLLDDLEALYGGATGGGKSVALLAGALQYVEERDYAALILRRTYRDLALPGALMDIAAEWLRGKAHWSKEDTEWRFPSGSTLTFGYLDASADRYRYQSSEFQYVAFDELTQFRETDYRYLFSRMRRRSGSRIPIRMRSASNPGGIGHDWVKRRFLESPWDEERHARRVFVPAKLNDNPYVDATEYVQALHLLDPITRQQYLEGDWDVKPEGALFKAEWFGIEDRPPADLRMVRHWDLAATEPSLENPDPDWSAGALVGVDPQGRYHIVDITREQASPHNIERLIQHRAAFDGKGVPIVLEEEPGASGKSLISYYQRLVLPGYAVRGVRPSGDKLTRAAPFASMAEAGHVVLVRGAWVSDFLAEIGAFPLKGVHDDQVDAVVGAWEDLLGGGKASQVAYVQPYTVPVVRRGDLTLTGERYVDKR